MTMTVRVTCPTCGTEGVPTPVPKRKYEPERGRESVNGGDERECAQCGGSLDGMRSHARYCCTSCRVLAYRARKRAQP
jgi:predicted RNA-binding Zn-ribbon protein involved in translation (DUF1610 family)